VNEFISDVIDVSELVQHTHSIERPRIVLGRNLDLADVPVQKRPDATNP
jgi:hypothetical protein